MLESVMFWNELNNPAHWFGGPAQPAADGSRPAQGGFGCERVEDPGWRLGLALVGDAAGAARRRFPHVERVFPGLSPMDPAFLALAAERGALQHFDAVAGHDFWVDFGPASRRGESGLDGLPAEVDAFVETTRRLLGRPLPVILSEIGVSSFAGDELQAWATERTLATIARIVDRHPATRATWYSLFDLPDEYLVTTLYDPDSHGEVRHRKFGLYRWVAGARPGRGGFRPKAAADTFARRRHADRIGITQWFRMPWPDPARGVDAAMAHELSYRVLEAAPPILRSLGVEWLRVNVTWCDWHSARGLANGVQWFDDLLAVLAEFRLLVTVFQTPHQLARRERPYASGSVPRPEHAREFTTTVLEILERYASSSAPAGNARSGAIGVPGTASGMPEDAREAV